MSIIARPLVQSRRPDDQIVAALVYHGLDSASASQLITDLKMCNNFSIAEIAAPRSFNKPTDMVAVSQPRKSPDNSSLVRLLPFLGDGRVRLMIVGYAMMLGGGLSAAAFHDFRGWLGWLKGLLFMGVFLSGCRVVDENIKAIIGPKRYERAKYVGVGLVLIFVVVVLFFRLKFG